MIDSSALIALFDKRDQYHRQAIHFRDNYLLKYNFSLYTSNYVYSEVMSHLTYLPSSILESLDDMIRNSSSRSSYVIKQLWVTKSILDKSIPIFFNYLDLDFSITDCTCFTLMQTNDINAAFSFDDDFKIYKYAHGHTKKFFWKLPEMFQSYLSVYLPKVTFI